MRPAWIILLAFAALPVGAQLPSPPRVAELLAAFPAIQQMPGPEATYIRDPRIRREAAPREAENMYTAALARLSAAEATRAVADAEAAAARRREAALLDDAQRARAALRAAEVLLERMQGELPAGDPNREAIIQMAVEARTKAEALLDRIEQRLLTAAAERAAAEEKAAVAQSLFLTESGKELQARAVRNAQVPAGLNEHGEVHGIRVQQRLILVRFRDQASVPEVREVLRRYELEVIGGIAAISLFVVNLGPPARESESDLEHLLRLTRVIRELSEEAAVFSAVQQLTLSAVRPKREGAQPAFGGSCWEWYDANSPGQASAGLIQLAGAWDYVKQNRPGTAGPVNAAVIDDQFEKHQQLTGLTELCKGATGVHGTQVAGILSGTSGNSRIGGNVQVSNIATCAAKQIPGDTRDERVTAFSEVLTALVAVAAAKQKIVTMSLGYGWQALGIDAANDPRLKEVIAKQGALFRDHFAVHENDLLAVGASGNDSLRESLWSSPVNWAALGPPNRWAASNAAVNVLVVGAVTSDGQAWVFANGGGHVAAPGHELVTCHGGVNSGTSLAAPVISGIAALMLAQNPGLKPQRLVELIKEVARSQPAGLVNAREAVQKAHQEIARERADLNDDGRVDWADFVMFRDAFVNKETTAATALRADLNGDGTLSAAGTHSVPGFAQPMTDLQVLQAFWEDQHVAAGELEKLLTQ